MIGRSGLDCHVDQRGEEIVCEFPRSCLQIGQIGIGLYHDKVCAIDGKVADRDTPACAVISIHPENTIAVIGVVREGVLGMIGRHTDSKVRTLTSLIAALVNVL